MFTGIVEELGTIESLEHGRLRINASTVLEDAGLGDSLAVSGCCLTLVAQGDGWWEADVSAETLVTPYDDGFTVAVIPHTSAVTTLGTKKPGDLVNIEVDVIAKYVERMIRPFTSAAERSSTPGTTLRASDPDEVV